MNKNQTTWLALSVLLLGQAACAVETARAGDFDVKDTTSSKDMGNTVSDGNFGRQKFSLTLDTRFGYDDNTLGTPDSVTVAVTNPATGAAVINPRTNQIATRQVDLNSSDSAFFNFDIGVNYTAANPRAALTIGADVGISYYFDRPGRDYDINGGLSGRFTYKLTPRAFLDLSTYDTYQSAGDYGASNLSGFTGETGVGGRIPGTTAARTSDYFYTSDRAGLTYQFTQRFSTVFSENIVAFAYDDDPYSTDQDRIESYTGFDFQYLLQPNLTLAATYRFGYIDYFGVSEDSQTHFVLGGADYSFSQRLHATFRGGVEFRVYFDDQSNEDVTTVVNGQTVQVANRGGNNGNETSPYYEAAINYDLSKNSHLGFSSRYGIEEGVLATTTTKADTFRAGIDYSQNFTSRISGYVSFYYTHAAYETLQTQVVTPNFDENTYDVAVGARYAINRHLAAEIGYTHTTFDSQLADRNYDRNRYFGGLRVQF